MDPKKMLITPEKTVEADEKKTEEVAAALQQRYDRIESFVEYVEKNPEAAEFAEKELRGSKFQAAKDLVTKSKDLVTKFPDFVKTAYAILSGKPLTEEDISKFRDQIPSFRETFKGKLMKWIAENSPEDRERMANNIRKMHGERHSEVTESVLQELKIVDSEEPSNTDTEKKKA